MFLVLLGAIGIFIYPKLNPTRPERKILYWADPMLPGDRSDRPGKSPMGMERVPVYEDQQANNSSTKKIQDYYTCPMHPSVHKDSPGACPVCGMTLVKKSAETEMNVEESRDLKTIALSPSKQVLANVSTSVAKRMSLTKQIHAVGKVDYAEPNFRNISMRFPGRLEKLYLTFTGQKVKKGGPVADVYSPEAISAQQEYLLAKESYDQVKDASEIVAGGALSLLQQSKQKLLLWGFTEAQITELEQAKQVKNAITIYSPISGTVLKKNVDPQHYAAAGEDLYDVADLSTVWLYVDVYEFEVRTLNVGQTVDATADAYPGEVFMGKISFVSPTVDPSTRTVRVRVDVPNLKEKLKPGMFVNAIMKADLPPTIVVPMTALLSTGHQQIVWVQKEKGVFEPRIVTIGEQNSDAAQILEGINEGEVIVTSGGYLIDSESQLEASASAIHDHTQSVNKSDK